MTSRRRALLIGGISIALAGPLAFLAWGASGSRTPAPVHRVVIAAPVQPGSGNIDVALAERLFEQNGLHVVRQPATTGMRALGAVLENKADLAVVADTPFMMNTMNGHKLCIIATIYESRKGLAIIARTDRSIDRPADLRGKRIGVTYGTNAQFFLDTMLLMHGVEQADAAIVDVPGEELVPAIKSGRIDAVTAFNPHLINLVGDSSFPHRSFYGEELTKFRFNIVATQEYAKTHQQVLDSIAASLVEASGIIRAEPERARKIISKASNIDDALIKSIFNPNDYDVHLDQSLLLSLEDQSRWAIKRKLVPTTAMPDYLNHIDMGPLSRIDPTAVTIIR